MIQVLKAEFGLLLGEIDAVGKLLPLAAIAM